MQAPASPASFPMLIYKYTQSLSIRFQAHSHHAATQCHGHGHSCCAAVVPRGVSRSLRHVGVTVAAVVVAPHGVSLSLSLHRVGAAVAIIAPPLRRVGCRRRSRCAVWVSQSRSLLRVGAVAVVAPCGVLRSVSLCRVGVAVAVAVVAPPLRHVGCRGRGNCTVWDVTVAVVATRVASGWGERTVVHLSAREGGRAGESAAW